MLNDYFARLLSVLTEGEHCADILVMHPIGSAWTIYNPSDTSEVKQLNQELVTLSENLLEIHRDFVVPKGMARQAAEELAHQIAAFPQTCMLGDRISAYEQFDLPFAEAMANEFKHGLAAIEKEAVAGATRFAKGAGRHGDFKNL